MKSLWNKIGFQSSKHKEGERMKCSQMKEMISRYVDNDLGQDETEALTLHIRDCSACREALEETRVVHALFASAERFEAPMGFAARVAANLKERNQKEASGFWNVFAFRPFFLHAAEVVFALVVIFIGVFSGNILVAERTSDRQTVLANLHSSFSLDLFRATPPGSLGNAYASLMGATDER
jgi:anti-sigma factor RsiW